MTLAGRAILAFSHDVVPGAEPDWLAWHDREHIPERLSVPGFLGLRRYVALDAGPRYFYFYEVESLAVLQSAAYLERLGHPTPWTTRSIRHVVNNKRTACRITAAHGHGLGGALAVIEIGPAPGRAEALRAWLAGTALGAAVEQPGMTAAHLGGPDAGATQVAGDEKKLLRTPDAMARWFVLVEGADRDAVTAAIRRALGDTALRQAGAEGEIHRGLYQLGLTVAGSVPP